MNNFSKSGFSLVEVMMAMALLGVVSLGTMQIMKNVAQSSKTSEVSMEVNSVTNALNQALINSDSCTNTFKNLGPIGNGLAVNEIKNRTDDVLFDTTQKYGNNQIKILNMTVGDLNIKPLEPGFSKKFGNFNLEVKLEKIGKGFSGQKSVTKKFPINAEFSISNSLTNCFSSADDAIATAEAESCRSIGGTFELATSTCTLSTDLGKHIAASTENLDLKINDIVNNILPTTYVLKAGDTMTGALTISGANLNAVDVNASNKLIATTSVCVGNRCRDFTLKQCNKDSIQVGTAEDGSAICTPLVCQTGQYLEKLDAGTGLPICKAIPTTTCPLNQFVSEIRPDGTVICMPLPPGLNQQCPKGQYVQRINPNGVITCSNPNVNYTCGDTSFVAGFDADGKALCRTTARMKLSFSCSTISTSYNSSSDNQNQSISCGGNTFLSSISIRTDDHLEAIQRGTCCTPNVYWDPADPTLPAPNVIRSNQESKDPNKLHDSDNQWHSEICSGGKGMHSLKIYATERLDDFEGILCSTPEISNVPTGYTYSLGISSCRYLNTAYTKESNDTLQSISCANDEVLTRVAFWAGRYLEYIGSYSCCKIVLNE